MVDVHHIHRVPKLCPARFFLPQAERERELAEERMWRHVAGASEHDDSQMKGLAVVNLAVLELAF